MPYQHLPDGFIRRRRQEPRTSFSIRVVIIIFLVLLFMVNVVKNLGSKPLNNVSKVKSQVCTFSDTTDKDAINGILYATDYEGRSRKRSDLTITSRNNTKIEIHLIIDSKVGYIWGSGNKGVIAPVEQKSVEEILGRGNFTNFKCQNWVLNDGLFEIPTNIEFTEIEKLK